MRFISFYEVSQLTCIALLCDSIFNVIRYIKYIQMHILDLKWNIF